MDAYLRRPSRRGIHAQSQVGVRNSRDRFGDGMSDSSRVESRTGACSLSISWYGIGSSFVCRRSQFAKHRARRGSCGGFEEEQDYLDCRGRHRCGCSRRSARLGRWRRLGLLSLDDDYALIRTSRTCGTRLMMCARIAGENVAGDTSQSGQPPEIPMIATPESGEYSTSSSRQ
jgi:hypothetical protein